MEQLQNKKQYIDLIYDQNFKFYNAAQAITQSNLLDSLSFDIYTDAMRFLIEILQNIDDSSFDFKEGNLNMQVCISKQTLMISHKGKGFNESDIKSLCSAGISTKRENSKATGYKGIGFKSVFAVADKVLVISNGYNFKFDKKYFTSDKCWQSEWGDPTMNPDFKNIKKPWQIIPMWIDPKKELNDNYLLSHSKENEVNFVFFIKSKEILEDIRKSLTNIFELNPMNIVFLKSKNIIIHYQDNNKNKTVIEKKEVGIRIYELITDKKSICFFYTHFFNVKIEDIIDKKTKELISADETVPNKLKNSPFIDVSFAVKLKKENGQFVVCQLEKPDRLIYSYLPTIENFDFPFLVNSNFILDAGRIKLKQHLWNLCIMRELPKYFLNLYDILLENFGNSYVEVLVNTKANDQSIKYFYEAFDLTLKKIINKYICKIKTKKNIIKPINECYIEDFTFEGAAITFTDITKFFNYIYGGVNGIGTNILKEFFSQFNFEEDNEIDKNELGRIETISNYFNSPYFVVDKGDFISFLSSDTYKAYANDYSVHKIIEEFKNNMDDIKNLPILYDQVKNFRKSSEFIIKDNEEEEDSSIILEDSLVQHKKKGKKQNIKKKVILDPDLVKAFKENEDIYLLELLEVEVVESNSLKYFLNNFEKVYNQENSIRKIREGFGWYNSNSDIEDKKKIIELFKTIKFLTNSKHFLNYQCLNVGKFYKEGSTLFDEHYSEYSISNNYYEKGEKSNWLKLFKEIGILYQNVKILLFECKKEIILDLPYFTEKYKNTIEKKLSKNILISIIVYPFLKFTKIENYLDYYKFLRETITERKQYSDKINKMLNDFFHFFVLENNLLPTSRRSLAPINNIYNSKIEEDKNIKNILDVLIDFPVDNNIEIEFAELIKFKKIFNFKDIPLILNKTAEKIINTVLRLTEKKILLDFFKRLFKSMINNNDIIYEGYFLDVDEEFKRADELYFIKIENLKPTLLFVVRKNKLNELLPLETSEKFFNFCKRNKVRIYDKDSIKYYYNINAEQNFLIEKLLTNFNIINEIRERKGLTKLNNIQAEIKKIKIFSCSNIEIKTEYNDKINEVPAYYDKDQQTFRIFYLEDNDPYTWDHSTIIYFISLYIAKFLNSQEIHPELISILLSRHDTAIEKLKDYISN